MSVAKKIKKNTYAKFDQIDGSHPLKKVIPDGYVAYPARVRKGGDLTYFNFDLAKTMGLIDEAQEDVLTEELSEKILSTFSLQIINEFDQINNIKINPSDIKEGTYMATRYLQLQHEDKIGLNSGDGRSIWNGCIKNKGKIWDISSCGTGATKLSPATSKHKKFFETGDPTISYGCGYAEIDEGLATAFLSSIFSNNGLSTEQTLAVIEFKNNISINVRAHSNLLRPSHFFLYLKQNKLDSLTDLVDYYISREAGRGSWKDCPKDEGKYDFFLERLSDKFAEISARFEDDYIFCWLDWDGDNILMDGGVIDYGSVRQFGLCHSEYRYDDVERFSTNLLEQKGKAKYIVQTFAQLIDYVKTKNKKTITKFKKDKCLDYFEQRYAHYKKVNLLTKIGFTQRQSKQLIKRNLKDVEKFQNVFAYFEKVKSKKGKIQVSDGVTWDAVFCMRSLLRELPHIYLIEDSLISDIEFMEILKTSISTKKDLEINNYRSSKIKQFQKTYRKLVSGCSKYFQKEKDVLLNEILTRSNVINKAERVTGDAITHIVQRVMKQRTHLSVEELYKLVHDFKITQNLDPEQKATLNEAPTGLLKELMILAQEGREGL